MGVIFWIFYDYRKIIRKILKKIPRILRHTYTLILIVFSRAIFYFLDFGQLKTFIGNLFYSENPIGVSFKSDLLEHLYWFVLVIILCIPWDEIYTSETKVSINVNRYYQIIKPGINLALLFLATILLVNSSYNPFLYTRF